LNVSLRVPVRLPRRYDPHMLEDGDDRPMIAYGMLVRPYSRVSGLWWWRPGGLWGEPAERQWRASSWSRKHPQGRSPWPANGILRKTRKRMH